MEDKKKSDRYPCVVVNLEKLKRNAIIITGICRVQGISVCGVFKGLEQRKECIKAISEGGVVQMAGSRIAHLEAAREAGVKVPLMLLRMPMLSEVESVVQIADYSLATEKECIAKVNECAGKYGKVHNIILMADIGDLREGYWDKDELVDVAEWVENELENVHLAGVGINVGCYGGIEPTPEKLSELVVIKDKVEARIGRKLEIISGGGTTSLPRILMGDGNMPKGINHLRIGEGIILSHDLGHYFGVDTPYMEEDTFKLQMELVEVKEKPSYPVGELGNDVQGRRKVFIDKGIRKKGLAICGYVDYGNVESVIPLDKGVEILEACSDYTLLDLTEARKDYKIGDILEFSIDYEAMAHLAKSKDIEFVYEKGAV